VAHCAAISAFPGIAYAAAAASLPLTVTNHAILQKLCLCRKLRPALRYLANHHHHHHFSVIREFMPRLLQNEHRRITVVHKTVWLSVPLTAFCSIDYVNIV